MEGEKRASPPTRRGGTKKERSGSHLPVGETFVLQHAYRLARRERVTSLYTALEGSQLTFERPVIARSYEPVERLGLTAGALRRIRTVLARGGDGSLAIDVGEREDGAPFVVLRPPAGLPVAEWWAGGVKSPERLATLGLGMVAALAAATPRQRTELTVDTIFVADPPGGAGWPLVDLYAIGEWPTRAEVRDMTETVARDLVLAFPPECFAGEEDGGESDPLEERECADVFRVGAVLFELATGYHPIFASEDASEALAALVTDLSAPPPPVSTGSAALDALIEAATAKAPATRPALAELAAGLSAVCAPAATRPSDNAAAAASRRSARPAPTPRASRAPWLVMGLLLGASIGAFAMSVWDNRPPERVDLFITSTPTGMAFERVDASGAVEPLGRTPILLSDRPQGEPVDVRPVYEDGERGDTHSLVPELLEVIDACRSVHFAFAE